MKNNTPVVTAILTCMTDKERMFVKEAIESVKKQTIPCKLHIYVAEANLWIKDITSEDSTTTIRYVPLEPPGIIRNLGVQEADTEWIAFLDGDDVWLPNKIHRQLDAATINNLDAIAADHYMIDEKGKLIACALGGKNVPMTSSWMAKRDSFMRRPFNAQMTGEDTEWWRNSQNIKKTRLHTFLIKYRLREESLSTDTPTKMRKMKILKLSRLPGIRYLLIAATWLANKFYPKG